jgi:hypothetical protein
VEEEWEEKERASQRSCELKKEGAGEKIGRRRRSRNEMKS